ncbi:restriction endonuclease subunit S [Tenacibaculum piscium]|uniref:restriction endonuclease subunit S n=1 Tax=Tenacibaculum piscium TaxID=1458515 RepID=UPI001F30DB9A|nr:restriction endonuclease subunit S [Tenacibaculum piscium]
MSSRIDSEFFKKTYLKDDKSIAKNGFNKLVKITNKINVGFVGAMVKHYRDEGITILQTKNIDSFFINDNNTIKITSKFHNELKKSKIHKKDILIARSGSFGKASIYLDDEVINSSDIIIVEANEQLINPYFLVSFLNSKFGINQMIRFASGGLQGHVNLTILEELEVPKINDNFQLKIEHLLELAYSQKQLSKQTYTEAEKILLEELNLQNFEPTKEAVNIKSFSESFGTSGRLDAEYYQPKYEKIEQAIKSYSNGFETLDAFIADYSTGYPYKSSSYIKENGIPLIRINNVKKGFIDLSKAIQIPKSDLDLSTKDIALENDILISMSGTIGNSCKIPKGIKAVVNQRIMKITPKNFNNEVLPLLINSVIGEYQLNRIGTGGVQTNISSTDIRKIFIPKIIEDKQQQIADLIEQSFTLKKQSEHLLEVAKKAVEIAIEENEDVAISYINSQN